MIFAEHKSTQRIGKVSAKYVPGVVESTTSWITLSVKVTSFLYRQERNRTLRSGGRADLILQGIYADTKYNINQRPHNPPKQEGGKMSHIKCHLDGDTTNNFS
jgi:hypothetical protein